MDPVAGARVKIPDQKHCFAFASELSAEEYKALRVQFESFSQQEVYEFLQRARGLQASGGSQWKPPHDVYYSGRKHYSVKRGANVVKHKALSTAAFREWTGAGLQAMALNRVAVVLQAWRSDGGPQGIGALAALYDLGLPSGKSAIQILLERVKRLKYLASRYVSRKRQESVECGIPVYFLCSVGTVGPIERFLREHDWFGMPPGDVQFFPVGSMPVLDRRGRYMLETKKLIKTACIGDGGVYKAMYQSGVLADMKARAVERVFIAGVDNLLLKIADPCLVGFGVHHQLPVVLKCVQRRHIIDDWEEFTFFANFKPADEGSDDKRKIAYVAAVPELGWESSAEGPGYEAASSGQVVVDLNAIEHAARTLHTSIGHLRDEPSVERISPETGSEFCKPAIILELRHEDIVSLWPSACGLLVPAEAEIALVRRDTGRMSPSTACVGMGRVHQSWLVSAGAKFEGNDGVNSVNKLCEISPLVSYAGEQLHASYPRELTLPFCLPSRDELRSVGTNETPKLASFVSPWDKDRVDPRSFRQVAVAPAKDPDAMSSKHSGRSRSSRSSGSGSDRSSSSSSGEIATSGEIRTGDRISMSASGSEFSGSESSWSGSASGSSDPGPDSTGEEFWGETAETMEAIPASEDEDDMDRRGITSYVDAAGNRVSELLEVPSGTAEAEAQQDVEIPEDDDLYSVDTTTAGLAWLLCNSDSDEQKAIQKEKKALRYYGNDPRKRRMDRPIFSSGTAERHHYNEVARAVRRRRAKIYRTEFCDPGLQGGPWKPSEKEQARSARVRDAYKLYDPQLVILRPWNTDDQGVRRAEHHDEDPLDDRVRRGGKKSHKNSMSKGRSDGRKHTGSMHEHGSKKDHHGAHHEHSGSFSHHGGAHNHHGSHVGAHHHHGHSGSFSHHGGHHGHAAHGHPKHHHSDHDGHHSDRSNK